MISSNRFLMAGFLRMNFGGLSKAFKPDNHVVKVTGVQFVKLSTFKKIHSVVGCKKRYFSRQIAENSEAPFEDVQGLSKSKPSTDEIFEDVQQGSSTSEPSTSEIFEEIAAGDPDRLKKLKMMEFELAVLREEEHRVPDKLNKKQWEELLGIETVSLRRKYLAFLRLNELKYMAEVKKSAYQRDIRLQRKEELGFHYYGLGGHSMFMRIYEKTVFRNHCLRLLNPKLEVVMDCSYDEYMSQINLRLCAKQITLCCNHVKTHKFPTQLTFCNLSEDSKLGKVLPMYNNVFFDLPFIQIRSESYLDLYPKERLVYLTPHTKNELKDFNPDDIFIIGAYVDKGNSVKASLAKAKEHKLRVARLPIDEYLVWKSGTKSLPLTIVLNILLDMGFYNDWRMALKHIPRRCLAESW